MKIVTKNNKYNLTVAQRGQEMPFTFDRPFRRGKEGFHKEDFTFKLNGWLGEGSFGQDALWLPIDRERGIKILRAETEEAQKQYVDNVEFLQDLDSSVLPEIYSVEAGESEGGKCVVLELENVKYEPRPVLDGSESYLPFADRAFIEKKLYSPLADMKNCIGEFRMHDICPEDDWFKNSPPKGGQRAPSRNLIGGKMVDFHNFKYMPERYVFPSNGYSRNQTSAIYNQALIRYRKWMTDPEGGGQPKWKGKIYQGMGFDNGFEMPGYSSDNSEYDSFVKLCFMPMNKVKGKKVLDLGSNQGFFSFQAALHGADEVLGIELTPEDAQFATEVNENLLKFDNVRFKVGDVVEHIENDNNQYEMIILNSVLHQIYKHMDGSERFLNNIAERCRYLVYETPANHHKVMGLPLEQVYERLVSVFGDPNRVRLLYVYDAYSTGYRANFVCYTHG